MYIFIEIITRGLDVGCDIDDNELIGLEVIHRLVQALDGAFGNVSELDILYGMDKVCFRFTLTCQFKGIFGS